MFKSIFVKTLYFYIVNIFNVIYQSFPNFYWIFPTSIPFTIEGLSFNLSIQLNTLVNVLNSSSSSEENLCCNATIQG